MRLHANAELSLKRRRLLARRVLVEGWSLGSAAAAAEVSERTAGKWVRRYREEGEVGLLDRSSAPHVVANRTAEDRIEAIAAIRRLRFTAAQIAETFGMPDTTVSGILTRIGLGRLGRLGLEPAVRYERGRPGELLHIDIKKLGRIQVPGHRVTGNRKVHAKRTRVGNRGRSLGTAGWEFVHVCVDDATRMAYVEVLPDEKATTAIGFLRRAVAFYRRHGITVESVMTDNGSAYRSTLHAIARRPLPLAPPRAPRPHPRPASPPHPPLPAPDQRQSRALHPHHARRMGLRRDLPRQHRTHRNARRLALALQLQTKPRRHRPQAPGSSPHRAEQPARVLHLAV